MDNHLLPEDKWIYMTRKREDTATGMWFYICSSSLNGENNVSTPSVINTVTYDSSLNEEPYAVQSSNTIGCPVNVTPPSDLGIAPCVIPCDTNIEVINGNVEQTSDINMTSLTTPLPLPVPVPITRAQAVTIHPEVQQTMDSMLNAIEQLEIEEIKSKVSQPLGINIPKKYQPAILIEPPENDPATTPKKRKNKHPEYDPLNPRIEHPTYPCNECDKIFKAKGALRRHKQSMHSNETFGCEECGKKLLRKDSIRRHYKTHHKDTPVPEHLIVNNNDNNTPPKIVKFNLKAKSSNPIPMSQFAPVATATTNNNDLILKLINTLQSYKH
jgi:hypothetical protein